MKFKWKNILMLVLAATALISLGCAASEDDEESSTSTSGVAPGDVINTASSALTGLASLSSSSLNPQAGVANDYCNANGEPLSGGSAVASSSSNYASASGYCQATFNAQSQDTPVGAMYLAGAIACEIGQLGLFSSAASAGAASATGQTVTISTTCWGSQAQVDAMVADMGSSTVAGMDFTASNDASVVGAYDYFASYRSSFVNGNLYIASDTNNLAALFVEMNSDLTTITAAFAINLDLANGVAYYENVDASSNLGRLRLRVEGTVANNQFTALTSIAGLKAVGSSSSFSYHLTFNGDLTNGFVGAYYDGSTATAGNCHLPTNSSAACTGISGIASNAANGISLVSQSNSSLAAAALATYTSSLLTFSSVDPTDTDLTQ